MALTQNEIVELYTATFNRAADAEGVAYWETQTELTQLEMANAFVISEEAAALYPDSMTDEEYINAIYQNNFNRDADADGLAYWLAELTAGTMTREDMVVDVVNGATDGVNGNDLSTLDNKTEVSVPVVDEFREGIWDVLAQAGITPMRIVVFLLVLELVKMN